MNPAKQYDKRELRIKHLEAEMRRIRNENLAMLTQPPGQDDERGVVLAYLKAEVITLKKNIMELVAQNKILREKLSDAEKMLKVVKENPLAVVEVPQSSTPKEVNASAP